jgi:adenylate cyclase
MVIIFSLIRFILWQGFLFPIYYPNGNNQITESSWSYNFGLVCIFTLFMSVFISFFVQINKKFGPGVLLPLIMGKYVYPKIEERAFIFLDLKSSTTLAERLGHVKYSQLIRDCFQDINHVSIKYEAEIYQYVGDEIVLCWLAEKDADLTRCIDFYFDCQATLNHRKEYYLKKYNTFPEFKAGLHNGIVTGVEVGDVKREMAFHGDTLNVAARIQSKCNQYNADIIISETVFPFVKWDKNYQYQLIGTEDLKGRKNPVTIYSIILSIL